MSNDRRALFTHNRELIEHVYARAVEEGRDRPVILVFDLEDEIGRSYGVVNAGEEAVAERIAACRKNGLSAVMITFLEYKDALEGFAPISSGGAAAITSAVDAGLIPVAIVGDGGLSWVKIPPV